MSQQMNMSAMGAMAGMGGPGAPVAPGMANSGTPANAPTQKDIRTKFHTFIYDYFVKTNRFELARTILTQMEIESESPQKPSPNRKEVNGDSDSKEDVKRPDDLPNASVPSHTDSPFLYDWFCQFWDLFEAQRGKGSQASRTFLGASQQRMMNAKQMRENPQMQVNMAGMRNGMMPNGMAMNPEMARKMMMQNRANPAQMQQMQQQTALRQQQMMQQNQMQREGSSIDVNGQQRAQSPGSGENAPSPKRQRLEGSFNGAPIGQMGRGQAQGMPGQQQVEYSQGLRQSMTNAMNSNMNKGMPGNAPVMAQGSPAMDPANAEFLNGSTIRPAGNAAAAAQGGTNNNSNHALQDYQMQLMLLEQQNKKRLLMARQEQDNMTNGPGGPAPPGQPGAFAPAMSPSGSRAGLSPNSSEQMKRGTPKMSQGVVPSPTPDGAMGQGRASPAPGFDPSQMNPNMPQNMFPQMNKIAMMGPNGQMIQPPSSHPMGGQMTQQQMEMFARANGGRMPNGFMPQPGPPGMMPGQQPGVPMQQPPNMTPHQRNAAMPPPPAPTADAGRGTQPSSPQQPPAPPTPSQGKNSNTKGKKDNKSNKKAPPKKGTAATPVMDTDQPPTPTPAPPITPTSTQPFPPKAGQPGQQPNQQSQQTQSQNPLSQSQPDLSVGAGPFGNLDGNDFSSMNLDFGNLEGPDVLDNFDFDSFLNNEAGDANFGFDANMGFDTGLEAGGVD